MENMVVNNKFWSSKNIFITGHTGFKGSWLTYWLRLMGANITGYSLSPPSQPNLYSIANISEGINDIHADIRDTERLQKALQISKPEIIFHCAAQSLVRYSYEQPIETFSTNISGTLNLFEAARKLDCIQAIVNVTSDKCYENKEWVWGYREDEKLGGHDPYSASKACAEIITNCYRNSYFEEKSSLASVRAGNVIGGGDWSRDRLIPDLIRALESKKILKIRHPNAIRPWQHVLDALFGYILLAEKLFNDESGEYSQSWNFGPAQTSEMSVIHIIEKLKEYLNMRLPYEAAIEKDYIHEANILKLDSRKAYTLLNWYPKWNIDQSLYETATWYKTYLEKPESITNLMTEQINKHQNLL